MQNCCLCRSNLVTYEVPRQFGCCLKKLQYCYCGSFKIAPVWEILVYKKIVDKKPNLKYWEPFLDVYQPHTHSLCDAVPGNRKGLAGTRCVCVMPVCMYVNVSTYLEGTSTFKITCQLSCSGWQMWDGARGGAWHRQMVPQGNALSWSTKGGTVTQLASHKWEWEGRVNAVCVFVCKRKKKSGKMKSYVQISKAWFVFRGLQ